MRMHTVGLFGIVGGLVGSEGVVPCGGVELRLVVSE